MKFGQKAIVTDLAAARGIVDIKKISLIFDEVVILNTLEGEYDEVVNRSILQGVEDGELNWLIENKIISIERDVSSDLMFSNDADLNMFKEYRGVGYGSYLLLGGEQRESYVKSSSNFISRFNSIIMGNDETRAVPLLYDEKFRHDILGAKIKYPFLEVAPDRYGLATASIICMLPVPGDLTPWERILDFRQEKENWSYFLNLRNFIRDSVNGGAAYIRHQR